MFELEIEQLKKFLTAQLPQAQPYVFLRDILSHDAIAESYKRFFMGEVDWWLYEEQNQWLDHHRFDTSAPEFAPVFKQLEDALRQNAHFDHDVLLAIIDSAAKVRLNFLCRPRTTLKWFVYRGGPTKTIYEILLRLEYLADYSYLTKGFYAWARKTYSHYPAMDLLSVVEFQKIIETIDNEYILDLSPHQFVDLLAPLFEFFNPHVENQDAWTVPTEALIVFLDDKKVELIAKELERMLYEDNLEQVSQEQFLELVIEILTLVESGELVPDFQVIDFEVANEEEEIPETETEKEIESEYPPEPEFWEAVPPIEVAEEITPENSEVEITHETHEPEFWEAVPPIEVAEEITPENSEEGILHETHEPEFREVVPPIEVAEEIVPENSEEEILHETHEPEFWEAVPPIEVAEEITPENSEVEILHETHEPEFWEVVPPIEVAEEIAPENSEVEILNETHEPEFWEVVPPIEVAEEIVPENSGEEILHETHEPEFWEVVPPIEVAEEIVPENSEEEILHETPEPEFQEVVPPIEVAEEIVPENSEEEILHETHEPEFQEADYPNEVAEEITEEIPEEIPTLHLEQDIPMVEQHLENLQASADASDLLLEEDLPEAVEIIEHEEPFVLPRWETIIDSKLKEKFVKKLFDGNEGAYHKLLGELDDCPSWAKADAVIVRYFIRAKKRHTDSIAEEFGRTIQKRFLENQ